VNAKMVGLAGALVAFLASPAGAQTLTAEKARAIVAPFYEALNRPAGLDVVKLIEQATSSDWMTCGGNDACIPREKFIGGFKSRGEALPDVKWEIKEVLIAGDRGPELHQEPSAEFPLLGKASRSWRSTSTPSRTARLSDLIM
jgi:hypothetical protein